MKERYFNRSSVTTLPHGSRTKIAIHQNLRDDIRDNCLLEGETIWQAVTRLIIAGIESEGHVIPGGDDQEIAA